MMKDIYQLIRNLRKNKIHQFNTIGKERGNSYRKNEEFFRWKAHKHTEAQSEELWCGAIFTKDSHPFTLFWLRKTSVIVKMFQLSFCVSFIQKKIHFCSKSFLSFPIFVLLFFPCGNLWLNFRTTYTLKPMHRSH